ncbi:MAG: methyltransferase domain-containing protein [Bacteroidales bacterium]|jgi:hypothetical protein|nr:methyltransferase domain-containing protein [Bacteroidales bacterium]
MTQKEFNEFLKSEDFTQIDGIWYSRTNKRISYPSDAHDDCFNVEEKSFWFNHRNNIIYNIIKKYSPKELFFDIGGGNGYVTKSIESINIPTVLVEPGKNGAENAKKRNISNILCASLDDISGLDKKINAAGAFDVIEHISNDYSFIQKIFKILSYDGFFFITLPAYKFLWSNEDVYAGHYKRYNLKDINAKLKEIGFTVLYSSYFFSALLIPVFLFRSIPSKLKIRKKSKKTIKKEHELGENIISYLIKTALNWEYKLIDDKIKIPFGSSCLIVAQKKYNENTL